MSFSAHELVRMYCDRLADIEDKIEKIIERLKRPCSERVRQDFTLRLVELYQRRKQLQDALGM